MLLGRGSKSYLACKAFYGAGGVYLYPPAPYEALQAKITANTSIATLPSNAPTALGLLLDITVFATVNIPVKVINDNSILN